MNLPSADSEHSPDDLVYRVRVEIVAEILDRKSQKVVAAGDEESMKKLYRILKRRES